ncbi:MAG: HD domain-containing protein [Candidatus Saccharibacteria bacterium]|nr:HD domain-containing protein [Candidatus Saccharibacteria bacterium]
MAVNITNFISILIDFQAVERNIPIPKLNRPENDTEHSYNLAMAAWLIISKDNLPLDLSLVIKYALIHDLVEVYAGDAFPLDDKQVAEKSNKEHQALLKLKNDELTSNFAELIEQYEKMADEESKFIYGLDKLMPAFTLIHGDIALWKKYNLTQKGWENKFRSKIEQSQYLKPYLDQFIELQKTNPHLLA